MVFATFCEHHLYLLTPICRNLNMILDKKEG